MIRLHRQSIFVVLIALLYTPSNAIAVGPPTVLTFDDVATPGGNVVLMPPGYGGLNWASNMGVWGYVQPPFNAQSPPNRVLFNFNGELGTVESLVTFIGGPKIFDGAYFSGASNVQFNLYSGTSLVATSSILSLGSGGSGPTFLASGYASPVDKVGIVGSRGLFSMDNFTFEQVPEPSTLLLLGIGAISLLGYRKAKA
jgi:hypothetical protein